MAIDLSQALTMPPPIPDKMEIIPIHASDRATFKQCRRKWDWTSPSRHNLTSKASVVGVNMPLWFGTGIHYALEKYYDPVLSRDPVESFLYWFDLTWRGGVINQDELELSYDTNPVIQSIESEDKATFKVRGLMDILPDPDQDEYLLHRELGKNMMEFYKVYSDIHDNFAVIMVEHTFSIPLGFEAIDPRDGQKKEVHARGKQDMTIQDLETGRYGMFDHKTAIRIDEGYFEKLNKDDQVTTYMWAAEMEAAIHDLPYKNVDYLIYQALRKAYPKPPTILKSGFPSMDRQKESTTAGMFKRTVEAIGLNSWLESNEKAKAYLEYLENVGDEQFIIRTPATRNKYEKANAGAHIQMEARDMLSEPQIYPNPTGDWSCLRCAFRAPCLARDDGGDFQTLLDNNYEKRRDR